MAETPVFVTQLTSGVPIAGDSVVVAGSSAIAQQVKLMGGAAGDTTPIPAVSTQPSSGSFGLPVWVGNPAGGASTQVISGTVQVSGPVQVSGTVQVSGGATVNVSGVTPTTTASGLSGVTALPVWVANPSGGGGATATVTSQSSLTTGVGVWLAPTQTITVAVSGIIPTTTGSGLSGVTGIPVWVPTHAVQVSGVTPTTTASGLSGVTGLPVWVSTHGVQVSGVTPTTTGSGLSGVTALPVWFTTPISVTGASLNVVVSGIVSVTGTSLNVVVSGPVQISGVTPTTTASGLSGVTGLPVWVQGGPVSVTGASINVVVSGIVSVTGTSLNVVVSGLVSVTGTSLSVVVSGLVSVTGTSLNVVVSGTVAVPSMTAVSTLITLLGTVNVAAVAGAFSGVTPTTTGSGLSGVTGLPVWLGNPSISVSVSVSVSVSNTVNISSMNPVTTQTSTSAWPVWLAPTQTILVTVSSGSVTIAQSSQVAFMAVVTITSSMVAPTTMVYTIYTGNVFVAGATTGWAVPAGKNLRVQAVLAAVASSAVVQYGAIKVIAGNATAAPSISVTSTVGVVVWLPVILTATSAFSIGDLNMDVAAGSTLAIGIDYATTRGNVVNIVVAGYLF